MKKKLDDEERDLLESIERGEWQPVKNQEQVIRNHVNYALESLKKDKRINIRLASRDLELLQKKALEEGLPYQTYISSILHKFVNSTNA